MIWGVGAGLEAGGGARWKSGEGLPITSSVEEAELVSPQNDCTWRQMIS